MFFSWLFSNKKVRYSGTIVDLVLDQTSRVNIADEFIPSMFFHIMIHNTNQSVGTCDLRIGMNEELYYLGNIGYHIFEQYRGNHYAYYATLILFQIAKEEWNVNTLFVTCSPENLPSKKTLEKLKGIYVERANVPKHHWLYRHGEKIKDIYRYEL